MTPPTPTIWPQHLSDLAERTARPERDEIAALQALRSAGVPVAPITVVPDEIEERFYRLNNLPSRLVSLFASVDPADPDEDDLEELAPEAMRLVARHFLLEEFVDAFYERTATLPARVRVRRPEREGYEAVRGRPALLALKRLWAADWSFEALAARLERSGTFAIDARPVLIHGADEPAPQAVTGRVQGVLGDGFAVWATAQGDVTRVAFRAPRPVQSGDAP